MKLETSEPQIDRQQQAALQAALDAVTNALQTGLDGDVLMNRILWQAAHFKPTKTGNISAE